MRKPTREQLLAALRDTMILRTERGGHRIGGYCQLCQTRWKGNAERHTSVCLLVTEETMPKTYPWRVAVMVAGRATSRTGRSHVAVSVKTGKSWGGEPYKVVRR